MDNKKLQVYLAAPFFNEEQKNRLNRIRKVIEDSDLFCWDVYHDGVMINGKNQYLKEEAFRENLKEIRKSDILIAITDEKDMGTIFEMGYSYNYCEMIIGYAESLGNERFNLMLAQSCSAVARNIFELAKILTLIKEKRNVELKDFKYTGETE